jgi:uncharacterized protein (DUF302 family)
MAVDGLTTVRSSFRPKETDRLEAEVKAKGMMVFARIDHAAGAADAGLPLRPTEVLLFGNPKGGTPLMQAVQTVGIDLPLKALVWQDGSGTVWPACSTREVIGSVFSWSDSERFQGWPKDQANLSVLG